MAMQPAQSEFVVAVAHLIFKATELGYQLTFGDAYRDSRCSHWTETSFHGKRLAIDFNLFRNGLWLQNTADHRPLGEYWQISCGGTWGGNFAAPDGNHYSWGER